MGYVHDTTLSVKVALEKIKATVGTWTIAVASNVWSLNKTAAADTSVLHIPLDPISDTDTLKGSKLTSIDFWYTVTTADCTDNTFVLQKVTLPASGGAVPTVATVTTTYDSLHTSTALRKANGATLHKLTLTPTTPVFMSGNDQYYIENTVDCSGAATSVVKLFAVRANYTLRL